MVELDWLNIIIQKKVINEKFPLIEDVNGYLCDKSSKLILDYFDFDDYIYCINFSSYQAAEDKLKILQNNGFEPITLKKGILEWNDLCVIDLKNDNINLPCEWLFISDSLPFVSYNKTYTN